MQIKDLILKTEKVNWQELKDLQPNNLKTPYHSNATKESLIKNGFAFTFYAWQDKDGNKYLIDGHLRSDLLRELKNDGYDIPDQLNCTFLDLPDRKTAIRYLLEVFNTKKNPIDETTMIDWIKEEDIDIEEVSVDWLDMQTQEKEIEEPEVSFEEGGEEEETDIRQVIFFCSKDQYIEIKARTQSIKETCSLESETEAILEALSKWKYDL